MRARSQPIRRLPLIVLALAVASVSHADRSTGAVEAETAADPHRILYASDWSGTGQIYAADPWRRTTGQLTFGRAPACKGEDPCGGYVEPRPSPDGSRVLFWDTVSAGCAAGLFVARADGRVRRRLADAACYVREAAWSPDSGRIAYLGRDGVHVIRADGSGDRLLGGRAGAFALRWSPDGRTLAFRGEDGALVVARAGRTARLAERVDSFVWSPDSRWIAYSRELTLEVVRATGGPTSTIAARGVGPAWSPDSRWIAFSGDGTLKIVRATGGPARTFAERGASPVWSPDGRFLAFTSDEAVGILRFATGAVRSISVSSPGDRVWAPRGHLLAFVDAAGIHVVDAAGGQPRRIVSETSSEPIAWSPDGRSVAYRTTTKNPVYGGARDLRVATLAGRVTTVVAAMGSYGGEIRGWAWTRPPSTTRYKRPAARTIARISPTEVVAPWTITHLAADGGRAAYVSCGHVFVWTPAARAVVQADPLASAACVSFSPFIYSLALAGDRVAYGSAVGNAGRTWALGGMRLGAARSVLRLEWEAGANGWAGPRGLGDLVGSRDLLTFSRWNESPLPNPVITKQTLFRVDGTSCPCPALASSEGPLVPYDVDDGRVVAGGTNETWLLDGAGRRLLRIPFSPAAAQLSGSDLVLVRQGELRHHDAVTGALLHVWPLPDVPSGFRCGTPSGSRCGSPPRLVLEDAARGLVVYVLDGHVHLLRLVDGADAVVAPGSLARLMDAGLVYADGSRLRLVPFDRLPLR